MTGWPDRPQTLARSVERAFSGTAVLDVLELKRWRLYRLRTSRDRAWLVRLHEADRHAAILSLLADRGYRCPRIVEASDGRRVVGAGDARYIVLEWIDGSAPWPDLGRLEAMGHALGLLHSVPVGTDLAPEAGMLPRSELGYAEELLTSIRSVVPRSQRRDFETLERTCAAIDFLEDLPRHLLHGDAHPWNAIAEEEGRVILIDWDSAGLGPPVVDLGFLLLTCLGGAFSGPVEGWAESRLRAAARGYASARRLTAEERERLPAAAGFRPLVGAVATFVDAVRRGTEVEAVWWWQRHQQASRVADLALPIC